MQKKHKRAIELMYAYAHTPLDERTIELSLKASPQVMNYLL